jgi:sphinganine-1-phosphate aldolase
MRGRDLIADRALRATGAPWNELLERMNAMRVRDADWRRGRMALHVYHADDDVLQVAQQAYVLFSQENALAPAAFPSIQRMEREVVTASLGLLGGGTDAAGSFTSGGTESIILAMKSARTWSRSARRVSEPNVILPDSAHPAYDKAAELLGLQTKRISIGLDYRADLAAVEASIDDNTMAIVASAPSLPFGTIDAVERMGQMALSAGLWLHVDACLGGYLAPFVRMLGYDVPAMDLSVPGVRSLSADLHKYGYGLKGSSVILYSDTADWERQRFELSAWPKGHYQTSTLAGTRSGGTIAAAWAVMNYLGRNGYMHFADIVMKTRRRLEAELVSIDGFHLFGDQRLGVIAFGHKYLDIFAIADQMETRGWYVSRIANPPGMQKTITPVHAPALDAYVADLREACIQTRARAVKRAHHVVMTY